MMDRRRLIVVVVTLLCSVTTVAPSQQSRVSDYQHQSRGVAGALFPSVFNLASGAEVTANATCGQSEPEIYCKLVEHVYVREPQCGVCDDLDDEHRHPIENVIDGTNSWWQSPTLQNGRRFEWVTITLDLKQVYQVAYVIVKSAISPRPGNWILERSLDGVTYSPWQYYAVSDAECSTRYGIEPREGNPSYRSDSEVICTSFYSKLDPLEDGEIHTSLIKGRPGSNVPSQELLDFTRARYVRLRLQKIRTLNADLMSKLSNKNTGTEADRSLYQRLFYSIKDISIGGQCVCNGHASSCPYQPEFGRVQCKCERNTCGANCDQCCPLFNQRPWRPGTAGEGAVCEQCQCHGHAAACRYDAQVDRDRKSLNAHNDYQGGGVCLNCTDFTTGINCETCLDGYFRPLGASLTSPCLPCHCNAEGSAGQCDAIGNGQCKCKPGFGGPRCDRCAPGYHSFPDCEPCACDTAGISDPGCRTPCQCKVNVEGERCDRCKPGYFDLNEENPEGCSKCFCFDRSGRCIAADLGLVKINTKKDWLVTDLLGRRVVAPSLDDKERLSVANDDMADFESYYWLAPADYIGKKLTAYAQTVKFVVSWVKARGDSSGRATRGPDVIMEGAGMKIGFGDRSYRESNTTITWPLRESKYWYHIPDNVQDIVRRRRTEYKGDGVTKAQLMLVLNDLKRLMIRAKFHTDQIEGLLHEAEFGFGSESSSMAERARGVEQCVCPPGYAGLSCEECAFGYVRRNSSRRGEFECVACQCHGHAATCQPDDLAACSPCLHNTIGAQCDACAPGYYGDARSGRPDACKRCRCPLEVATNNFSPTCTTTGPDSYTCDRCPPGYEGHHCQRCSEGYFGNPLEPGGFCRRCDCNGNHETGTGDWCDRLTGQCLKCKPGVAGTACQICAPGFYGSAVQGTCRECHCHADGSASAQCDIETGQCQCRDRYAGRHCDRCKDGYGDIRAGCRDCRCDPLGSVTVGTCDGHTGQCHCRPGVGGLTCNECLEHHYGISVNGCHGCNCHQQGSRERSCNVVSGQCECRPNVVGLKCDQCKDGYWDLDSGRGCQECSCDPTGSANGTCHPATGACHCLPGVGGKACDQCLHGFYGFSSAGCKQCDPCDKPGHICDPDTGRCVCPPGTEGQHCEKCSPGTWNHHPIKGCQICNCHLQGSRSSQCDHTTGQCSCRPGYAGQQCDRCSSPGFYGFPHCQPCDCHPSGTDARSSRGQCAADGQCPCKPNVTGRKCDTCKDATFGLLRAEHVEAHENDAGCTPCFCFGRSSVCSQAHMIWTQTRMEGSRGLSIAYDPPAPDAPVVIHPNEFPVNTQEICYINLALPGDEQLQFKTGEAQLNVTNNLRIVPDVRGDVMIGVSQFFNTPLYWQLPGSFLTDRTASYNGLLRFTVTNKGGSTLFPDNILSTYPLVQIQGNRKIVLEYYPTAHHPHGHYQVRLHESLWKLKNNPRAKVSRMVMMIALQNVQHILIRATDSMDRTYAEIKDVSLEVAIPPASNASVSERNVARGVESCQCPLEYSGFSCQDPNRGFYRRFKYDYLTSNVLLDLVGEAHACQCNGRSETCDKETGKCLGCRDSTTGDSCQLCAKGYFGDPGQPGGCRPCACPSTERNFADSCHVLRDGTPSCTCARGYRGERCQKCDYGYFGNPLQGVPCQACSCNANGSVSDECDEITGQCNCKPGITGRDCSYCAPRHVISPTGCTSCEVGCTGDLFRAVDRMTNSIARYDFTEFVPLPWTGLFHHENTTVTMEHVLNERREEYQVLDRLVNAPNILPLGQITLTRARGLEEIALRLDRETSDILPDCSRSVDVTTEVTTVLEEIIAYLKNYAIGETPSISINKAMAEAESHWQYIQSIDVATRQSNAQRELDRSRKLLASMRNLFDDGGDTAKIRDHLEGFRIRLEDLESYVHQSRNATDAAFHLLTYGNATLESVRYTIAGIASASNAIEENVNTCRRMNANASLAITRSRVAFQGLRSSLNELRYKKSQCATKTDELGRLLPEYKRQYVVEAQVHANSLWRQAQALFNQFNATRDVADHPLQAANAYRSIVEALKLARQAAEAADEAAETAYSRAYPDDVDLSLVEQAKVSMQKSRELLTRAEQLQVNVASHKDRLKGEQSQLDLVDAKLKKANSMNKETQEQMEKLPQMRDRAKAAVEKSTDALSKSTEMSRKIMDLQSQIDSELRVKLLTLQNNRNIGLGNIPKLIDETRKNIKHIDSKMTHLSKKHFEFRSINSTVSLKLDELKRKIMRAKQAASSIRVSLSGKSGNCHRSFSPPVQPSTTSSIALTYAFNHKDRDALLFYLPATKKQPNDQDADFLAIEMVNRQIRFLWNAGGGTTVVTHPLKLQPSPDDLSDDSRWYKIEAERSGNVGHLKVRPMKSDDDNEAATDGVSVSQVGPPKFTKIDLMTGDRLYIGRAPDSPPAELKTNKFTGHIHQLWFDGQPIGLWNFMTSSAGCGPSIEGAQETKDESSFRFNGQGYAELEQIPRYDSRQYSVTFSFKSLDENALLFLAINDTVGQYISLELTEGLIRYQVRYGAGFEMSLQSRQKYNTGQWVKVEASRVLIRGVETVLLTVAEDEELSGAPFNFGVPDLELEEAKLYIGGLPPDVKIPLELMSSVPGSFLGCMKDIQVVAFGMNPLQGSYYGVEASCSSQTVSKISAFTGNGYIQLKAPRPGRDLTVSLSFKTESPEGILLFSAPLPVGANDEPHQDEEPNRLALKGDKEVDMMSLAIRQGQLEARFRANQAEVLSVISTDTYNDGEFHNVVVIRTGRKIEVLVDDVAIGTVRLARPASSSAGSSNDFSHLMLGGIRPEWLRMTSDFIGTQHAFTGCIADLTFNNQLIDLSYPVKHAGAAVGRCQHIPPARVIEEPMQANENALSSCREVPQYTIEGRAFKFGDAPHSHVTISVNRKELQNNFNFTLDFRTHYPNGMLLFSSMKHKKVSNYLLVALKNGKVAISLHGKRQEDLLSAGNVNDGNWHRVHIAKDKRKITLVLDDFAPVKSKAPSRLQLDGQIFVGGLPDNLPTSTALVDTAVDGFKGCIRNLNFNGRAHDLASNKNLIHRVGQCFAHVETGSYFPGDAYAVYSEDFRVGSMADIQLEFRTTEMNGVLLSVSEQKGSPSLTLYLEDGRVIFAVDMGDNRTVTVAQSFSTPYQVCDNRWHSVKASYVENALALKVDNLNEQYGLATSGQVKEAKTRNPLYIGGLPDMEPQGALRSRDNFKGCIRNVVIRGEIKDWTDMAKLNNVLLNACPIH